MASCVQDIVAEEKCKERVGRVSAALGANFYAESIGTWDELGFALLRRSGVKRLLLLSESDSQLRFFQGDRCEIPAIGNAVRILLCPLTSGNARALRERVPFLKPSLPGEGLSVGTGDRLGLATPGHVRAFKGINATPVLAQQSIRELSRTRRSPIEVLDDATWGALQGGYREGFGADADHVKTIDEMNLMLDVGFTMYTVDPGSMVDDTVSGADPGALAARVAALPWEFLESSVEDCRRRYAGRRIAISGFSDGILLELGEREMLLAVAKYGHALARIVTLYRYLASRCQRDHYVFEVAVDETDTPTSPAEHFFVASELRRLGVRWQSFAPRFCGEFFKGVDYVGDLSQFRSEFNKHVKIAEHFGGYKLSLHSGSDKFSIYPIVAELAGNAVHLKTSGTSYLEALRAVASLDPPLFREILASARRCYEDERLEYNVKADVRRLIDVDLLRDKDLASVLQQTDTRQICHVTFGSVLNGQCPDGQPSLRDRLIKVVSENEEYYYSLLEAHFRRHLSAFV